jgi:hypothetical protein
VQRSKGMTRQGDARPAPMYSEQAEIDHRKDACTAPIVKRRVLHSSILKATARGHTQVPHQAPSRSNCNSTATHSLSQGPSWQHSQGNGTASIHTALEAPRTQPSATEAGSCMTWGAAAVSGKGSNSEPSEWRPMQESGLRG